MNRNLPLLIAFLILLVLMVFALYDSLGFSNTKGYTGVNHGSHVHYVPDDRNPEVGISKFPMTPPKDNEYITPNGIIKKKIE